MTCSKKILLSSPINSRSLPSRMSLADSGSGLQTPVPIELDEYRWTTSSVNHSQYTRRSPISFGILTVRVENVSRGTPLEPSVFTLLTDAQLVISIVSHERESAGEWDSDSSDSSLDGESGSEPEDPLPSTTELEERFLEVKHIITCLYKLSIVIQSPASRDRIQRCAHIEVGHYEYFDIAHVSEKFPLAQQFLIDRLGRSNTKRRQLLEYHKRHHDKLALYIDAPMASGIAQKTFALDLGDGVLEADAVVDGSPTAVAATIAKTLNTQTTVSTFFERPSLVPGGSDTGQSQISHGTSVGDDTHTKLRIPAPPIAGRALDGEPFECPYCFCMVEVEDSRAWM